jgi:hypothetical protein
MRQRAARKNRSSCLIDLEAIDYLVRRGGAALALSCADACSAAMAQQATTSTGHARSKTCVRIILS